MTLEDIYTELNQIADDLHFLEYCDRQYQTSNKAELLAVCQERGLAAKKSDKKDTLLHILRKDYERKMEIMDARATTLQREKAAIKTQIAAQLTESEQEATHPVASPAPFNPEPFCQALAMAVAAYIPPFEVCGSWEVDAHFQASRQLDKWQAEHPDVDITPLIFGYFVDDGIEIEDFDLGEPGPREGEEEDLHPTHGPLPAWMYEEQEPYALSHAPMQQQREQEQPPIIETLHAMLSERRDKPGQDMLLRLVQEYEDEGAGNDGLLFAYIKEAAQTLYEIYERVKPEQ